MHELMASMLTIGIFITFKVHLHGAKQLIKVLETVLLPNLLNQVLMPLASGQFWSYPYQCIIEAYPPCFHKSCSDACGVLGINATTQFWDSLKVIHPIAFACAWTRSPKAFNLA
jgi:hypothetical protein